MEHINYTLSWFKGNTKHRNTIQPFFLHAQQAEDVVSDSFQLMQIYPQLYTRFLLYWVRPLDVEELLGEKGVSFRAC